MKSAAFNIKIQAQLIAAVILVSLLFFTQVCRANSDNTTDSASGTANVGPEFSETMSAHVFTNTKNGNPFLAGPVILTSSDYNLFSRDGSTVSGKIIVKNSSQETRSYLVKNPVAPIVVDPNSSCYKDVGAGRLCEFKISYTGKPGFESANADSNAHVRFEVADKQNSSSDVIIVNVGADDHCYSMLKNGKPSFPCLFVRSFATVNKNGVDFLYFADMSNGIFKTSDGGKTFIPVNNGLPYEYQKKLALNIVALHSTDKYLYASYNNTHEGSGVIRTNDGGASWEKVPFRFSLSSLFSNITYKDAVPYVLYSVDGYLYAANFHSMGQEFAGGVLKIKADGTEKNWTIVNDGLPSKSIKALHWTGGYLYAGMRDGVFRIKTDGTETKWTSFGKFNGFSGSSPIESLHSTGGYLYAGTRYRGVFKIKTDGTETELVAINGGRLDVLNLPMISDLYSVGDDLYAATEGLGVLKIKAGGTDKNWTRVGKKLGASGVDCMGPSVKAIHFIDGYLFAATYTMGVYRMKIDGTETEWEGGIDCCRAE